MPKKLRLSSSERLDLPDANWGFSGYAQALSAFNNKKLFASVLPRFISGFNIEIADQDLSPGQITVYNGYFIDRTGNLVTAEDSVTSSQSITLTGTSTTFYIEIAIAESDTDPDDRGVWDSSASAGAGAEFVDTLNTRTAVTWSIVSPVSTTNFDEVPNSNSVKIPLAILKTDSVGKITTSVNTGLTTSPASTVIVDNASIGDVFIKVADSTLLPSSGNLFFSDIDSATTEIKAISSIDRANHQIVLSSGLLNNFPSGSTVLDLATTRVFVNERETNVVGLSGASSVHPDKKRRLFSGDETSGRAMFTSKYDKTKRNDLNIDSLKSYVDFLAAQVREIKVGSSVVGSNANIAPPASPSSMRYYDYGGSIVGAKEATYTIATNGLGDFNGTTQAPFVAAIAAATAAGYSSVRLFVKRGTYNFTGIVSASINVFVEGEVNPFGIDPVFIQNTTTVSNIFSTSSSYIGFKNIKFSQTQVSASSTVIACTLSGSPVTCELIDCYLTNLRNRAVYYTSNNVLTLNMTGTTIDSTNSTSVLISAESGALSGYWSRVTINNSNTTGDSLVKTLLATNLELNSCVFISNGTGVNTLHFSSSNAVSIYNTRITHSGAGSTTANVGNCVYLGGVSNSFIKSSQISVTGTNNNTKFIYVSSSNKFSLEDCTLTNLSISGSSAINCVSFPGATKDVSIKDNTFNITISGTGTDNHVINKSSSTATNINIINNTFNVNARAVSIVFSATEHNGININNNFIYGGLIGILVTGSVDPTNLNNFFPHIVMSNNLINCKGTAFPQTGLSQQGICVEDINAYSNVKIYGNTIEDINCANGYGINVESFDVAGLVSVSQIPNISITDNKINRITTTADAIGIRVHDTDSFVKIQNNNINHIVGAASMGIWCDDGDQFHISGNTIVDLDNIAAVNVATGIYLANTIRQFSIDDNLLDTIGSTTNTSEIFGIGIVGGSILGGTISRNKILDVENNGVTNSGAIYLTGDCGSVVISNNMIKDSGKIAVWCNNVGGSISKGLVVDSNTIDCDAFTTNGIRLTGSSSSNGFSHFVVKGNTIVDFTAGSSTSAAIFVDRGVNFTISGNSIVEATSPANPTLNAGLRIANSDSFSITGNSFRGVANNDDLTRGAIIFSGTIAQFNITGNTFRWTSADTPTGRELYLPGATFGMISGNFFQGSANFGVKFTIRFSSTANGVYVTSNFFRGNNVSAQIDEDSGTNIDDEAISAKLNMATN